MRRGMLSDVRACLGLLAVVSLMVVAATLERPPVHAFETVVVSQALLTNVTTGTAVVSRLAPQQCRAGVVYVNWGAGTTAGAVIVESAATTTYAGTWVPLATVAWSAASKTDLVAITGVHGAIRTRVSVTITGGTVSTFFLCN